MNRDASYTVCGTTEDSVTIRDTGDHRKALTITNDAERVVKELTDRGFLKPGRKLFYYDSQGDLSGLLHDGQGTFLDFGPGPQ